MTLLDKIINIKYNGHSNISLAKVLLMFYLIVGNSYTKDLYSGQMKEFIKSNRLAQHIIALITMLVLITTVGEVTDIKLSICYSLIAYSWFVLTTKLDIHWNIAIFALLVMGFMYDSKLVDKEVSVIDDEALNIKDIKKIKRKHKVMRRWIMLSTLGITVLGTLLYVNKKQVQYGGGFDPATFLLY